MLFEGLDLGVQAGGFCLVRGPNGAGKSSLLRILAGLRQPDDGEVVVTGLSAEQSPREAIHYLGHQDGLRGALSVAENLSFLGAALGRGGMEPSRAMDDLGIARLASLPVGVLSAGQRRRVALAAMLIANRAIWLMDEPSAALDQDGSALLNGLIANHRAGGGLVIAATHLPLAGADAELVLGPAPHAGAAA